HFGDDQRQCLDALGAVERLGDAVDVLRSAHAEQHQSSGRARGIGDALGDGTRLLEGSERVGMLATHLVADQVQSGRHSTQPSTLPAESPETSERWNKTAKTVGGRAARTPTAETRP